MAMTEARKDCGIDRVRFIHDDQPWNRVQFEVGQDTAYGVHFSVEIGIGGIHNVEEKIRFGKFFKGCLEGSDQVRRQIADETDGVCNNYVALFREAKAAGGGIQGYKHLVRRVDRALR